MYKNEDRSSESVAHMKRHLCQEMTLVKKENPLSALGNTCYNTTVWFHFLLVLCTCMRPSWKPWRDKVKCLPNPPTAHYHQTTVQFKHHTPSPEVGTKDDCSWNHWKPKVKLRAKTVYSWSWKKVFCSSDGLWLTRWNSTNEEARSWSMESDSFTSSTDQLP